MYLLLSLLVIAAIFSARVSSKFGMPMLIAFLGIGMIVGSDGLALIEFNNAELARRVGDLLLIFIIFDGGFQTKRAIFESVKGPALTLATFGVIVTAAVLGGLIHLITKLDLLTSMMIGSILSSTDAAAVIMATRQTPIRRNLATTLDVESAANDPMAILLTATFIAAIKGQDGSGWLPLTLGLIWSFVAGVGIGWVTCKIGRFLFDRLESENRGHYFVLGIAIPLLAYGAAEAVGANGIIAVFFGGYWFGNTDFAFKRGVGHFLDGVASFSNVALFLMLGVLANPSGFGGIWPQAVLISVLMILVARPVAVLLSTAFFKFDWRERTFLIWGGIKGAVPIVLATYPAANGLDPDEHVFSIVFFAVLMTCLVQGTTMGPMAKLLKLTVPLKKKASYTVELYATKRCDTDLFEVHIEEGAVSIGKLIKDLQLPSSVLISSIVREDKIMAPRGDTMIELGDVLFLLSPVKSIEEVTAQLTSPDDDEDPVPA